MLYNFRMPTESELRPVLQPQPAVQVSLDWKMRFFTIWTGQAFSLLGSYLVQFALVWWLTKSTGSATVLAMATLFGTFPQIALGPLAGALVDRWNRRLVMIVADSTIAVASLVLAILLTFGQAQVWHVFIVMLIRSLGGAFHFPAMQASTTLMVPEKHLARVAGMNQTLSGLMNVVSPPLGALLLEVLYMPHIMLLDVCTAAMAVIPLCFLKIPQPPRAAPHPDKKQRPTVLHDMVSGFKYIWSWPGLKAVGVMAALISFLVAPAYSLMPLFVTKHFNGQAIQLGLLNSAWGVGVIAGGVALSAWGGFRRKVATALSGLVGMGVGLLMFGLAPASAFWMGLAGMAVAGLMQPVLNGPVFAILQASVAPDMQGRVISLVISVIGVMTPLSLAVAGPLTDLLGIQAWYIASGSACVVLAIWAFSYKPVMQIENVSQSRK